MPKKLTCDEVVARARQKHGDKYDYSKVEYKNFNTNVCVICPVDGHGEFWQTPDSHLSGRGCPPCAGNQQSNSLAFIAKARQKHGEDRYDYSKVEYKRALTKVCIICPIDGHGEFWQTPNSHMCGAGCPTCGGRLQSNSLEFIAKARQKHGNDRYDYSKVVYKRALTKVCIICSVAGHGEFWQTPSGHLSGQGCSKCGGKYRPNTGEFITKAHQKHGEDRYDYSKVEYKSNRVKVCIICPIDGHGEFWQTPNSHLNGHGCSKCGGVHRPNSLEFIAKARQKHGENNYDYSKVEYKTSSTKVCIICPVEGHGEFWQTPINHLSGQGCSKCSGKYRPNTGEFITKARQKHGEDRYDYSKVEYKSNRAKVCIICPIDGHGEFRQTPSNHLRGNGCPTCSGTQKSNSLEFIAKARQKHGENNYDYSKVEYKTTHTKVCIICPVEGHGEFWQTPDSHLSGHGCSKCSGKYRPNTDEFIAKAQQKHGEDRYDYSKVEYKRALTKVCIICPIDGHGEFWQTPSSHMCGAGCPTCGGSQQSNSLEFIAKARQKHGENRYDYSKVEYKTSKTKVCIICPVDGHDEYWKAPHQHLRGQGCPMCARPGYWSVEAIRKFVSSLLPHLCSMTPAERYLIFQQNGLIDTRSKAKSFVKAFAAGRIPFNELEAFANNQSSLVDSYLDPDETKHDGESSTVAAQPDEMSLPLVQVDDALSALEHISAEISADAEAVNFLVASATNKLWTHAYRDPNAALAQARAYSTNTVYSRQVRDTFLDEFHQAITLSLPHNYDFRTDGALAEPNLMQKLVAVRVRNNRRFGNWSGTGAGKTLSAVLATRVVGAQFVLVCCPNAIVQAWTSEILRIFPDSAVASKTWAPTFPNSPTPRYLVQNYERFQLHTNYSEYKAFKRFCCTQSVDFVIIDEVHYAKQRHVDQVSLRKKRINAMLATLTERNPGLYVLGMTATPIINNLAEGRSLVEMITGETHDDLTTVATVPNCMRMYQRLVTLGTRYKPMYRQELDRRELEVDCAGYLGEIRALGKSHSPLALEKILTRARIPTIVEECRKSRKTLVYTLYVDEIDAMLYDALTEANLCVGFCTGKDKSGLDGFLHGNIDVLIGSSAIGTGVDGLQHVCNKLVTNVLPWTSAEYEQLVGRLYRQGQASHVVEVVIPTTYAIVNGEKWSYCASKIERLKYKHSIADAAVDGVVPENQLRTPAQAHSDLMAWLARLDARETSVIARVPLTVPLTDEPEQVEERKARYGDFSQMNSAWNRARSETLAKRLAENPEEWQNYHTLYREARAKWPVTPYKEMIKWARQPGREGLQIGDFGCGEAFLAGDEQVAAKHTIHSFDHVAINEGVIACDMAHVPLNESVLDCAVFCLSLMGVNFADYLREAHRVLKLDGQLHLWEATSRFTNTPEFVANLARLGFEVMSPKEKGAFTHITALKTTSKPNDSVSLKF